MSSRLGKIVKDYSQFKLASQLKKLYEDLYDENPYSRIKAKMSKAYGLGAQFNAVLAQKTADEVERRDKEEHSEHDCLLHEELARQEEAGHRHHDHGEDGAAGAPGLGGREKTRGLDDVEDDIEASDGTAES